MDITKELKKFKKSLPSHLLPELRVKYVALKQKLLEAEALPDTELIKLAKRIKPLIRLRKTKYYEVAPYHLFNVAKCQFEVWSKATGKFKKNDLLVWTNPVCLKESFYYALADDFVLEEDLGIPLPVLEPQKVAEFTCYLRYSGYYGILRPRVEDVLQQFPQNLITKGTEEYAFELYLPSLNFRDVYDALLDRHKATVIVYQLKNGLPKPVREQLVIISPK